MTKSVLGKGTILILALILCCGVIGSSLADEKYVTIKLDEFPEMTALSTSALDGDVLLRGRTIGNPQYVSEGARVYSLGKPLQVRKTYLPGNTEAIDGLNRSIADTTSRYVPEAFAFSLNSFSSAEYIERFGAGLYLPYQNDFAFGLRAEAGIYDLPSSEGSRAISTSMQEFELAGIYLPDTEFRAVGALVIANTHSVASPGLRARVEYNNRSGVAFALTGNLWTPWAENTLAVYNNGRRHDLVADAKLPFTHNLWLDLNAGIGARYAASDMFESASYEGTEISGQARLNWDFFSREYRQLPVDFLDEGYWFNFERLYSRVGVYASILGATYLDRDRALEDYLVPVTEEQVDMRLGLSAAYAFNSHFGGTFEAYVGADPARDIDFGTLFGFNTRLEYIPTGRMRVYGTFAMDSEAATGIVEGTTWYYGAGLNYKF